MSEQGGWLDNVADAPRELVERQLAAAEAGSQALDDPLLNPSSPFQTEPSTALESVWTRHPNYSPAMSALPEWMTDQVVIGAEEVPPGSNAYDVALKKYNDLLNGMNTDEVVALQMGLYQAGYYGSVDGLDPTGVFTPGILTEVDRQAFATLFTDAYTYGGARSIEQMLMEGIESNKGALDAAAAKIGAQVQGREKQLSDPVRTALSLQSYAQSRMGARLGYGQADAIAMRVQAEEKAHWNRVLGGLSAQDARLATAGTLLDPAVRESLSPRTLRRDNSEEFFNQVADRFGVQVDSTLLTPQQRDGSLSPKHELGLGAVLTGDPVQLERVLEQAHNMKGRGQTYDKVRIIDRDQQGRPTRIELVVNEGARFPKMASIASEEDRMNRFLAALRPDGPPDVAYQWRESGYGGWGAYNIPKDQYSTIANRLGISPEDHSVGAQDRIGRAWAQQLFREYGSMEKVARHILGGRAAVDGGDDLVWSQEGMQQRREWAMIEDLKRRAQIIMEHGRSQAGRTYEDGEVFGDQPAGAADGPYPPWHPKYKEQMAGDGVKRQPLSPSEMRAVDRRGGLGRGLRNAVTDLVMRSQQVDPRERNVANAVSAWNMREKGYNGYLEEAMQQMGGRVGAGMGMNQMYDGFDAEARAIAEFERTHADEIQGRNVVRTFQKLADDLEAPSAVRRFLL